MGQLKSSTVKTGAGGMRPSYREYVNAQFVRVAAGHLGLDTVFKGFDFSCHLSGNHLEFLEVAYCGGQFGSGHDSYSLGYG